jgi:hypothetical protein
MGMTDEEYRNQTGRFRLELVDDPDLCFCFWRLIDTATGEEVGNDSCEPEDKTLGRDLRWVVDLANKLAAELDRKTSLSVEERAALELMAQRMNLPLVEALALRHLFLENRKFHREVEALREEVGTLRAQLKAEP